MYVQHYALILYYYECMYEIGTRGNVTILNVLLETISIVIDRSLTEIFSSTHSNQVHDLLSVCTTQISILHSIHFI